MNTPTISANLADLSRKELIAAAVEAGIKSPYTTKSVVLIEKLSAPTGSNVVKFEGDGESAIDVDAPTTPAGFSMGRKTFIRQLAAAKSITTGHDLAVFKSVRVTAGGGLIVVEANDLSSYMKAEAEADATDLNQVIVPHRLLSAFIAKCGGDILSGAVIDGNLILTDGENRTEIIGMDLAEWVPNSKEEASEVFEMDGAKLRHIFKTVGKFASSDDTRFVLNSVGVNTKSREFVATDGRRLMRVSVKEEMREIETDPVAVLQIDAVKQSLEGLEAEAAATLSVLGDGRKFRITQEGQAVRFSFTGSLIQAKYPDYVQVIPRPTGNRYVVNREAINGATGRTYVIAKHSGKDSAPITLKFSKDSVSLSATGNGESVEPVDAVTDSELNFSTAINGALLLDITNQWNDDALVISGDGKKTPLLITAGDQLAVIMPLNLK